MPERFLLYIDILGFSDLVRADTAKVDDLYAVIASLNANRHEAFKCIIFSDTVVVYNLEGGKHVEDVRYLLMFLSEFARDLLHRLTGREIYFRAIITYGEFRHYELNAIPCFYGPALVQAYRSEKRIKAIGLFMQHELRPYSGIFRTRRFNVNFDFVYITQALGTLEEDSGGTFPFDAWYLEETDLIWMVAPELLHLVDLYRNMSTFANPAVKKKCASTLRMYERQYPRITAHLKSHDFDIRTISPAACWDKAILRYPESMSHAIRTRKDF